MDTLIQDALEFLKEIAKTRHSILATSEEVTYFTSTLSSNRRVIPPDTKGHKRQVESNAARPPPVLIKHTNTSRPLPSPPPKPVEPLLLSPSKPLIERKNLNDMH